MTRKASERTEVAKKISQAKVSSSLSRYVKSGTESGTPSAKVLEERDRRERLPDRRDLTGILLGDPPPDRSALNNRDPAPDQDDGQKSIWHGVRFDDISQ